MIDLGAPQLLRRKPPEQLLSPATPRPQRTYTPNPRLYPGPAVRKNRGNKGPKPPAVVNQKDVRGRRHKRTFRRPVPNPRLYQPAPRRPPPPPARPRTHWSPPTPPTSHLETASRVALQITDQRRSVRISPKAPAQPPLTERSPTRPPSRRLVVTLPGAAGGDAPTPYRPISAHFRQRISTMDAPATSQHSASPEVSSEGNETLSAPSEFLAEFLSAIMQRQYAEALKYCRLILQYEPHNATARGFYPLLRHKVHVNQPPGVEAARDNSSSESAKSPRCCVPAPVAPALDSRDMEQEADESASEGRSRSRSSGSCGSQSSLEMDSSEVLVNSSPSPSVSLSRKTDHTDSETGASVGSLASTESAVSRGYRGECTRCRSRAPDTDDNGNEPDAENAHAQCDDLENDNAPAATSRDLKRESSSLRRLRAQFACSIK